MDVRRWRNGWRRRRGEEVEGGRAGQTEREEGRVKGGEGGEGGLLGH